MQLSGQQLDKFMALYKAKFGIELDRQQAYEQAVKLIRLFEIIYKPISLADFEKVKKRQQELNNNN
jgi:RNA binding exosome subunit